MDCGLATKKSGIRKIRSGRYSSTGSKSVAKQRGKTVERFHDIMSAAVCTEPALKLGDCSWLTSAAKQALHRKPKESTVYRRGTFGGDRSIEGA